MAPASDNNNQDLATKKAKLDSTSTVLGGVGKYTWIDFNAESKNINKQEKNQNSIHFGCWNKTIHLCD